MSIITNTLAYNFMENKILYTLKNLSQSSTFFKACPIPHQRLNFQIQPKTLIWPDAVRGLTYVSLNCDARQHYQIQIGASSERIALIISYTIIVLNRDCR